MLINFQARFAEAVATGRKRQTIRRPRKDGRVPKIGEPLYLWTGCRTKQARKLLQAACVSVDPVEIRREAFKICDRVISAADQLKEEASADGYESWEQMCEWFEDIHGLPFRGHLIRW